jgi:Ni2+-binding GTPase involved in maturation of urease and hydrogenase
MNPRFIMIGGFLGAGKTTTIARLARHYTAAGKRVGIVTNDQTDDLVDSHNLRSQGFEVGEVSGSCFCCNFNALTATVENLGTDQLPDVILAEPVGSCTDLVATVIRPLTQVYGRPLEVAPYGVILKPSHGLKILRNEATGGFSPKAAYIFRKQLEEADFIVINRVDQLSAAEVDELQSLLERDFPGRKILRMSAKSGLGFDQFIEHIEQAGSPSELKMEVDYDIYAEGEAELGWLNSQINLTATQAFPLDTFLLNILDKLHQRFIVAGAEAAHLKAIGMSDGIYAVANVISNSTAPELSLPSRAQLRAVSLVVNARVAIDPELLETFVREALAEACETIQASHEVQTLQSFRPGRPVPTYRL